MNSFIKHSTQLAALCTAFCLLNSCYGPGVPDPYIVPEERQKENQYYAPATPNVPLLKEQYDLSGDMRISSGSQYTNIDAQMAYMMGKHLGIAGSYSTYDPSKNTQNFKFNRFEIGAGYVTVIDSNFHFESYAGYGTGKMTNQHYTGRSVIKNNYFFVQPTIAVSNYKNTVQFAFVSKFIGNHFNVADTSFNHDREPFSASQIALLQEKPFHIFWEPGFIFRFGWKHMMLHLGYSFSKDLSNSELFQAKGNFSAGLSLRFNALKQASK